MIRIYITAAAYDAIAATVPRAALKPPQDAPDGGKYIWLTKLMANRLSAARARGEGYSETIVRIFREQQIGLNEQASAKSCG